MTAGSDTASNTGDNHLTGASTEAMQDEFDSSAVLLPQGLRAAQLLATRGSLGETVLHSCLLQGA